MDAKLNYQIKQNRIINQLKTINQQGGTIAVSKHTSNLYRNRKQIKTEKLNFKDLNQVIQIDVVNCIAEVEAAVTYEDLVDETLKYELIPAVVPQFTTITVGGGVSGGACESGSFKYGATHETVEEMTVLLSDVQIVTATRDNKYRDLFLSIPNTFGSLGYILKLKIKLILTLPFVKLQHIHFTKSDKYFAVIAEIMKTQKYDNESVDFLDGVIFNQKSLHLTVAQFVKEAPYTSNYKYMNVYYKSIAQKDTDYLTTHDYIWRWDADWAWGSREFGMQNKLLRLLLGKFMLNSSSYWKMLNWERKYKFMNKINSVTNQLSETIVQDADIPINQSEKFLEFILSYTTITPIWICPLKSYQSVVYPFCPLDPNSLYINFGLWSSVKSNHNLAKNYYTRLLEKTIIKLHGYKPLYSESYYSEQEFWSIHDKKNYDLLKKKYDSQNHLKNFYQKVCKETA